MNTASVSTISFVTVLFNSEKYLPLFFKCLASQSDKNFEVVIIDNASSDFSLELVRRLVRQYDIAAVIIANELNLGIAAANNQGIESARGRGLEDIVLINNDIAFESTLVDDIRRKAVAARIPVWTCQALTGDSEQRWYGGGKLCYWRARGVHYDEKSSSRISSPTTVTYAPTCLMYVNASVFEAVGLMDERYFVYYDDTDFCKRLNIAGIAITYDPNTIFRHYVGGSSGGDMSQFFIRISTRNKFYYIFKNYRFPIKIAVALIALASKICQLASGSRRKSTLEGLFDVVRRD